MDARGIPVDSTTAVLLGPASRWRIRGGDGGGQVLGFDVVHFLGKHSMGARVHSQRECFDIRGSAHQLMFIGRIS